MSRKPAASLGPVTLNIRDRDVHGDGVGDLDGHTVVVPGTMPGDRVRAAMVWQSRTSPWARAHLLEVLQASPSRQPPPCPHQPLCVGCPLASTPQPIQLELKRNRLASALAAHNLDAAVPQVLPAPQPWAWRTRAKYVVGPGGLGAYHPGTHTWAPSHGCACVHPRVAQAAAALQALLKDRPVLPVLRHVVVRTNGNQALGGLVVGRAGQPEVADLAARWMEASRTVLCGVVEHQQAANTDALFSRLPNATQPLVGATSLRVDVAGLPVEMGLEAFEQVNHGAAAALVAHVVAQVAAWRPATVWDAYCGVGAFGLALRDVAGRVVGVDDNPVAIAAGNAALTAAGVSDVQLHCADATQWLIRAAASAQPAAEVVVVDPPRKGLAPAAVGALRGMARVRLVYVSCNPESLARDMASLVAAGWVLQSLAAFDLFPHTPQVETVACLQAPATLQPAVG